MSISEQADMAVLGSTAAPRAGALGNGDISFWRSRTDAPLPPTTERLTGDEAVDIAIVGGGLSGLWTAWALMAVKPILAVGVFEARDLAFGASGRNGGLLSTKPVGSRAVLAAGPGGIGAVQDIEHRLRAAMSDVVAILGAQAIDADHGGWMQIARTPSELRRLRDYLRTSRAWGVDEDRLQELTVVQAAKRIHVSGILGALFSPDNYSVDPVKMTYRLAEIVINAGVRIFTRAHVDHVSSGELRVDGHCVRASAIAIATEGYASREPGRRRYILPMNSAQLVTEPLSLQQWARVGWDGLESLAGSAHTYFYSKRTRDGRIAIGGRGRPYRFASGVDRNGELDSRTIAELMKLLSTLFPQVILQPAHAWCGVIGVTRDWSPFVDYDRVTKLLRLGGYVGQGLAASHLAGLIAADLLLERETPLASSAWVRPVPAKWPPEPVRWLGTNALYGAYSLADRLESGGRTDATSPLASLADRIARR